MSEQFKGIDIYETLGVSKDSSSQTVHMSFLKLVNPLVERLKGGESSDALKENLRILWVAHDILIDPDCRTDYDLRSMGIITNDSGDEDNQSSDSYVLGVGPRSKRASWRIGELLQAVGIIEQAELDIACDMHKAMPEMQFGRFLVKQGFLNEIQLEAILLGQTLIRSGEITLTQFITVMEEMSKSNRNIKEVLLELGYLKNPNVIKLENDI